MQIAYLSFNIFSVTPPRTSNPIHSPFSYPRRHLNLHSDQNPTRSFSSVSFKRIFESRTVSSDHISATVRCEESVEGDDGLYMRRGVELAKKAIGCTSPNPMVGCVIVKDGKIVGEGFHPKAGQPHAEVFALRDAGDMAEGATAYVTLEPCNHYGRTPPCSEALIKAKVKRVVVGMVDPNPIVDSSGIVRLRSAGIDVTVGVEEDLCRKLNEAFIHQMLTRKPFLMLRYSMSINGCLLDKLGEDVFKQGGYYSKLLQEYDAIILSSSLSRISSQEPGASQPIQILVARESPSKTVIFTDGDDFNRKEGNPGEALDAILEFCNSRGFCSVLLDVRGNMEDVEELVREGIEKQLIRKVIVEVLPIWSRGEKNLNVLRSCLDSLPLRILQCKKNSDPSILLEGYL